MKLFKSKAHSLIFVLFAVFKLACTIPIGASMLGEGEKISAAAGGTVTTSGSTAEDFAKVENSLRSMKRTEDDFTAEKDVQLGQDGMAKSRSGNGFLHKLKVFMRNMLKGIAPRWFKSQSVLTETKAMQRDIAAWKALAGGEVFLADKYTQEAKELYQKAFELKAKDIKKGNYPKDVLKEYPKYQDALKELEEHKAHFWGLLTFEELEKEALTLDVKTLERLTRWKQQSKTHPTKSTGILKRLGDSKKAARAIDAEVQAVKEETEFIDKMIIRDHMGAYQKFRKAESLHAQAEKYLDAISDADKAQIELLKIEKYDLLHGQKMDMLRKYRNAKNAQGLL